jgi:phosphatidylserine/phosphatidylglycerophosphate/cardiolipin synthase-like enzyme
VGELTTSLEPPIEADLSADVAPNETNTLRDRYDPPDLGWKDWFAPTLAPPSTENEVVGYVRGSTLFTDIASAMRTASRATHFVLIAGWGSQLGMQVGGVTLESLLTEVGATGAAIRALMYVQTQFLSVSNQAFVDLINDRAKIPNGAAVHDSRHLAFGAHHQKLVIVSGEKGLVAFCGGNDFVTDRYTIHDTHLRLRGQAAAALYKVFLERWNEHPQAKALSPPPAPVDAVAEAKTRHFVQVGRTYGNGNKHPGIDGTLQSPRGYRFAGDGVREVETMTLHAISRAKRFIYIEDQYLVSMAISAALAAAIPKLAFVLVVMSSTSSVNSELSQRAIDVSCFRRKRQDFLEPIEKAGPGKLSVFYGHESSWFHSKAWVVDDRFALVGSANVNRRGYTHDSEVTCGIFDANLEGNRAKTWFWPHEFRMNLWAKHLRMRAIDCRDPVYGRDKLWRTTGLVREAKWQKQFDNQPGEEADTALFEGVADKAWDDFVDPYGGA